MLALRPETLSLCREYRFRWTLFPLPLLVKLPLSFSFLVKASPMLHEAVLHYGRLAHRRPSAPLLCPQYMRRLCVDALWLVKQTPILVSSSRGVNKPV